MPCEALFPFKCFLILIVTYLGNFTGCLTALSNKGIDLAAQNSEKLEVKLVNTPTL